MFGLYLPEKGLTCPRPSAWHQCKFLRCQPDLGAWLTLIRPGSHSLIIPYCVQCIRPSLPAVCYQNMQWNLGQISMLSGMEFHTSNRALMHPCRILRQRAAPKATPHASCGSWMSPTLRTRFPSLSKRPTQNLVLSRASVRSGRSRL